MSIDADLLEGVTLPDGPAGGTLIAFERLRGLESSYWEHALFEEVGVDPERPAVSTVRALERALRTGVEVLQLTAANLAAVGPLLQLDPEIKEAVADAVHAGMEVTIPSRNVEVGGWRGVGYIVEDPLTGAGAYQISGGLSGGAIEITYPALVGRGPLGLPLPDRPTAIIAVGTLPYVSLAAVLEHYLLNIYSAADSVGYYLFNAGYNVYIGEEYADSVQAFVDNTGAQTPNDVFCFFGHGGNGLIVLPRGGTSREVVGFGPGAFSRRFKIVLLSACATGGVCGCGRVACEPFEQGDLNMLLGRTPCDERKDLQMSWAESLLCLPPQPPSPCAFTGSALVGYIRPVRAVTAELDGRLFWLSLSFGSNVGEAQSLISRTYMIGDPNAALR